MNLIASRATIPRLLSTILTTRSTIPILLRPTIPTLLRPTKPTLILQIAPPILLPLLVVVRLVFIL